MSSGISLLAEADLHGLVDGYIAPDRRVDALRRLAVSPSDRARVESWQGQNDLLRGAFTNIVREPLPAMLDLKAKPSLQCVPANDAPIIAFPRKIAPRPRKHKLGAAMGAIAIIAAGLWGSWALLTDTEAESPSSSAQVQTRDGLGATLAMRTHEAVQQAQPIKTTGATTKVSAAESLPTTDIPDLRAEGLSFVGAETVASAPVSIIFRYRDDDLKSVAVSVAGHKGAQGSGPQRPAQIGDALSWTKGDKVYAIAGTVQPAKLRALALALQQDDTQ